MSVGITTLPRRVIPRWRNFQTTASLGECNSVVALPAVIAPVVGFEDLLTLWQRQKTTAMAGEIISASIVAQRPDLAQEAALFLLKNPKQTTHLACQAAQSVLEQITGDADDVPLIETDNQAKVSSIRRILRSHPYDPIGWCEMARIHIINGKTEKARRAILTALSLGGRNRYILRSSARCFLHLKDPEMGLRVLNQSNLVYRDPWIASACLSLTTILDKRLGNMRDIIELAGNQNIALFHRAELLASVATFHLGEDKERKAKVEIVEALKKPTENVIAQAIWAHLNQRLFLDIAPSLLEKKFTYEANTFASVGQGNWEDALRSSNSWLKDEEFAGRPAIESAFIRTSAFDDHKGAVKLLKRANLTNPDDPTILNNFAFSLASLDRTQEARQWIKKVNMETLNKRDEICLTATMGLIEFREGNHAEGRILYQRASQLALADNQRHLRASALYHLAFEEKRIRSSLAVKTEEQATALIEKVKDPFGKLLARKIKSGALPLPDDLNTEKATA